MFRRFAQLLALLIAVVSVVSAQCTASCSLLPVDPPAKNHDCCPRHTLPAQQKAPCAQKTVHSDEARLTAIASVPAPVPIIASVVSETSPLLHLEFAPASYLRIKPPLIPSTPTILRL
jgi:hypothetical protein